MSRGALKNKLRAIAIAAGLLIAPLAMTAEINTGSEINIITNYRTLDALSWDVQTWPWKANHDYLGVETLQRGDLSYGPRGAGEFSFNFPDHLPSRVLEGGLAASWEEHPDRLVFNLREGVEWWEIPGVMERRPLRASDVANHFQVMRQQARYVPQFWEFIDRFEARDDEHQLIVHLSHFNGNWRYLIGWGYWSGILPVEWHALDGEARSDWKNAPGTGPYRIAEVRRGRSQSYKPNPHYWDTETIDGQEYQLPLNAGVNY